MSLVRAAEEDPAWLDQLREEALSDKTINVVTETRGVRMCVLQPVRLLLGFSVFKLLESRVLRGVEPGELLGINIELTANDTECNDSSSDSVGEDYFIGG